MEKQKLRLLIADDNDSDLLILKTILEKQGHTVYSVKDGVEALKVFIKERPDLVLLDALMPVMDGFQTAKLIKTEAGDDLVPVIFITSLKDATSLADCLQAGGDDFISKPYNRIVLHAKIHAHARMRRLHAEVQEQRDKISLLNDHLIREQEIAKSVFDNIAHHGCIGAKNIKSLLSPMAIFNGDMVLVAQKPSDGMYVMLGDFTGHGLPAAIGALPAAEIFYGMATKGFSIQEILREINRKLKQILPIGLFCCGGIIDLSFNDGIAKIWLGGLPDIVIYRCKKKVTEKICSKHLPLGVLSDEKFRINVDVIQVDYGDKIYLWSDGIHEAVNKQGEMFGTNTLDALFKSNENPDFMFEEILEGVKKFSEGTDQDDDHTLVEVTVIEDVTIENSTPIEEVNIKNNNATMDFTITCELRPESLRNFNPLPLVTHFLREVPGLKNHSGKLYTIVAELYSNALEHGVLGLNSDLKNSVAGFANYYRERLEALERLKYGQVVIKLIASPRESSELSGGKLHIILEDTGPGFDYTELQNQLNSNQGYSGRGISLIGSMCESVEYFGNGNIVKATYVWT